MPRNIHLIMLICCHTIFSCAIAQSARTFPAQQLKKDYQVLIQTLREAYPSLYRYNPEKAIDGVFKKYSSAIKDGMSEKQFFTIIAQTVTAIKDEHIIATPSPGYMENYGKNNRFLPFAVKFIDGRMYIAKSINDKLVRGSEILSINNILSKTIVRRLLPYVQHDGYIETVTYRHLEDYSPTQNQNLFDLYFSFGFALPRHFKIKTRLKQDVPKELVVHSLSGDQYRDFYTKRNPMDSALQYRQVSSEIAYLKINSFHESYRNMFGQNFDSLFENIFGGLDSAKVPNLILDLRRCEGGDNSSLALLSYLMNKPFRVYDYLEVNYSGYPEVAKYFENRETSLLVDSFLQRMPNGKYRLKEAKASSVPGVMPIEPQSHSFRGTLFVLTSGTTGSAAAIVASILKGNGRATFIGEETGGAMEGPTSLNISTLILPHTKIRVEIPHIKLQLAVPFTNGRGVLPDYPVKQTIDDLINDFDRELQYAIDLAGGHSSDR